MKIILSQANFEIIKNRLFAIIEEAGETIKFVSASPVANQVFDFNTGLTTASGDVFAVGTYISIQSISIGHVIRTILTEYPENPGIDEDDMFICNNPYEGVPHQSDVVVVAPVHWEGKLVAWCGSHIHEVDVGGPTPGQVGVGAQSIYEEAIPMPALKIIERGQLRKDIEKEYLIRSRVPKLVGLDCKAKIASNNRMKDGLKELIRAYGVETFLQVLDELIGYTERKVRQRLLTVPDGVWRHRAYLDYEDKIYKGLLAMTKEKDSLVFDYRGTSGQAPGVINSTYPGLEAYTLASALSYLVFDDIPRCPAGVLKPVRIISEEGSLFHARWPAGVSKQTTSSGWVVRTLCSTCLAKMLDATAEFKDRVVAPSSGTLAVEELSGTGYHGPILDALASGGGARSHKDGIDTGGVPELPSCSITDIETAESFFPILYLYRRQEKDSGGAGKYRGGVTTGLMYVPHGVRSIPSKIVHGYGVSPEDSGIGGGYPAPNYHTRLKKKTNIKEALRQDCVGEFSELSGEEENLSSICETHQEETDVFEAIFSSGGGGYGDPLERDPALVLEDVKNDLVSIECAKGLYGVVIDSTTQLVEHRETMKTREEIKRQRKILGKISNPKDDLHENV
jgi:N-methylhydantoinase B